MSKRPKPELSERARKGRLTAQHSFINKMFPGYNVWVTDAKLFVYRRKAMTPIATFLRKGPDYVHDGSNTKVKSVKEAVEWVKNNIG